MMQIAQNERPRKQNFIKKNYKKDHRTDQLIIEIYCRIFKVVCNYNNLHQL